MGLASIREFLASFDCSNPATCLLLTPTNNGNRSVWMGFVYAREKAAEWR